jgi:hypothetical protein
MTGQLALFDARPPGPGTVPARLARERLASLDQEPSEQKRQQIEAAIAEQRSELRAGADVARTCGCERPWVLTEDRCVHCGRPVA